MGKAVIVTQFGLGNELGVLFRRFDNNIRAVNLRKELEFEGRAPTEQENEVLGWFTGWEGLGAAFEEGNEKWATRFFEAYVSLDPQEYAAAMADAGKLNRPEAVVNRREMIKAFRRDFPDKSAELQREEVEAFLATLPSAEQVRMEWVKHSGDAGPWVCSRCGGEALHRVDLFEIEYSLSDYCPHCGLKKKTAVPDIAQASSRRP